jgi:hypothetical protein
VVQVAIYARGDPQGTRLLSALKRRIKKAEIRAWEIRREQPLTLVHSGERYARIRVRVAGSKTAGFRRAMADLGAFKAQPPSLIATISAGPSSDRVLGFLVGLLTRHAEPLGVSGVGIPLDYLSTH